MSPMFECISSVFIQFCPGSPSVEDIEIGKFYSLRTIPLLINIRTGQKGTNPVSLIAFQKCLSWPRIAVEWLQSQLQSHFTRL